MAILAEMTLVVTRRIVGPIREEQAAIRARINRTDKTLQEVLRVVKNLYDVQRLEMPALARRMSRIETRLRRDLLTFTSQ